MEMRNTDRYTRGGIIRNALNLSHQYIRQAVRPGDTVIDATAGRGNDTVFLADLVGPGGFVHAFDIQQEAIDATRSRLQQEGLFERCRLYLCGHEQMEKMVKDRVHAIMFNLGYLPGSDHRIGTHAETTIDAIHQGCRLLHCGGLITIGLYYGRESGFSEKEAVLEEIRHLPVRQFAVQQTDMVNSDNCPPIFIAIEKLRED